MANEAVDMSYLDRPDCKDLDHIPGSYGLPYFGQALASLWDLQGLCEKLYSEFGPVSRVKMLHQRGVLVQDADLYQRIYLDKEQNFSAEMGFRESIGQFYRGGVLMKDFNEHKFLRRLMQTAFKNDAMKNYVGMMNPIMQENIDTWDKVNKFEFFPHIKKTLLEVGAEVFIGAEHKDTPKLNQAFLDINEGLIGQLRKEWPGTKYNKGKKGERLLRDYFSKEVDDRRDGDGKDMLSFMCRERTDEGELFDKEFIIPQASFLLFAAHDTTTSLLNHMVYYSAMHPEWQEKMRAEALALDKAYLEYDDLGNMPVTQNVLFECLRLRPSVSFFARRTIKECEIEGHRIPADTMVFMSPIHNHHDEQFWTNPKLFDPDRFSDERAEQKSHSFAFHPFGGGAHKCIGMHFAQMLAKCFMHQLLLKYEYSLPENFKTRSEWVPLPKPASLPIQWKRRS